MDLSYVLILYFSKSNLSVTIVGSGSYSWHLNCANTGESPDAQRKNRQGETRIRVGPEVEFNIQRLQMSYYNMFKKRKKYVFKELKKISK